MKIRSSECFFDAISKDLVWRKKELSSIRSRINLAKKRQLQDFEIRAGILLLYAHWEGFTKFSTECYLNFVKYKKLKYNELSTNLLALSLKSYIHEFETNYQHKLHVDFLNFIENDLDDRAKWNIENAIDTRSNLNSEVLENILSVIGIPMNDFELKFNLLDEQLLKNRNSIAHGNYLLIDRIEYLNIHKEIFTLMNVLSNELMNLVTLEKYKKSA
ncbi:MAG: hypothetical protein COA33_012630 [Fluviicola sp.]|nr:hypothetical protein [Fluviicola sp.]